MSGWKKWQQLEVVTQSDLQNYLQDQVVQVYANSTARSNTLGVDATPGMVSYLQDTQAVEVRTLLGWQPIAGGAGITSVVAGTGLTGGGTAGTVTLNVNTATMVFGSTAVSSAYTAVAGLDNGTIIVTGTAAVTVTVPDVLTTGDSLNIIRDTSGTVTIAAGTGVTSWAGAGTAGTAVTFKIDQQFNGAQVIKTAANTYRVIGKIIP